MATLAEIFTNQAILKVAGLFCQQCPACIQVMHGAKQDMRWLQCDYSIFVVNLFDTGQATSTHRQLAQIRSQAARLLDLPSYGLAFAISYYCGEDVSELKVCVLQLRLHHPYGLGQVKYQTCDWRERPLGAEHLRYARSDTHYLLYIHDRMRAELSVRGCFLPAERFTHLIRRSWQGCSAVLRDARGM